MIARCRAYDWGATALGPMRAWPPALLAAARMVLDAPSAMCLYVGPDYVMLYNDAYRRILGAKHPAAFARPAAEVWREIWSTVGPQLAAVRAGGAGLDLHNVPFLIDRLDGGDTEEAWFDYTLTPVRGIPGLGGVGAEPGRIAGILALVTETTARVRSEQALAQERARLDGVLAAMGDAHFLLDADFRFVSANPAMERTSGKTPEELRGRSIWELFPATLGTIFETSYRRVATERVHVHFIGEYDENGLSLVPEVDAYPAPGGGVAVFWRDIGPRLRADREREALLAETEAAKRSVEQERERAMEASRAKSEFLTVMSHELRTPLNAIAGYTQLVQLGLRGPVTPEQHTDLDKIQRSQHHLLGLINGVLNYAKVEAGAVEYRVEEVDVEAVLRACETLIQPQAHAKGLTLEHSSETRGLRVQADAEKLQQLLLNLLSNAVKFTPAGGRIVLHGEEIAGSPNDGVPQLRVAIAVSDTGIGIAADNTTRVFEPFVQIDARLTRTQDGTGLGLAISRDLARGMGGEITVDTAPGAGSTFRVVLPAATRVGPNASG